MSHGARHGVSDGEHDEAMRESEERCADELDMSDDGAEMGEAHCFDRERERASKGGTTDAEGMTRDDGRRAVVEAVALLNLGEDNLAHIATFVPHRLPSILACRSLAGPFRRGVLPPGFLHADARLACGNLGLLEWCISMQWPCSSPRAVELAVRALGRGAIAVLPFSQALVAACCSCGFADEAKRLVGEEEYALGNDVLEAVVHKAPKMITWALSRFDGDDERLTADIFLRGRGGWGDLISFNKLSRYAPCFSVFEDLEHLDLAFGLLCGQTFGVYIDWVAEALMLTNHAADALDIFQGAVATHRHDAAFLVCAASIGRLDLFVQVVSVVRIDDERLHELDLVIMAILQGMSPRVLAALRRTFDCPFLDHALFRAPAARCVLEDKDRVALLHLARALGIAVPSDAIELALEAGNARAASALLRDSGASNVRCDLERCMRAAARGGHIEALQWCIATHTRIPTRPVLELAFREAIYLGRARAARWLASCRAASLMSAPELEDAHVVCHYAMHAIDV